MNIGPSPLEAFQIGSQLRGPTALGQFAQAMTKRAMDLMQVREEARAKAGAEAEFAPAIATAKANADVAAQQSLLGAGGLAGAVPTETKIGNTTYALPGKALEEGHEAAAKDSQIRIDRVRAIVPALQLLEQRASELPNVPKGGMERVNQLPSLWLAGATQKNPAIANYNSQRDAMKAEFGRMVDVGNLSKSEQETAISRLPTAFDANEVKARKIADTYAYVISKAAYHMREHGTPISEDDLAKELGVTYDPRTQHVTSGPIELLRAGHTISRPSQPGARLQQNPRTGRYRYLYDNGTSEEIP